MFGLRTKLPVTQEEQQWVDEGFHRLKRALGERRMRHCAVVLPTDEFFPDHWDGTEAALEVIFRRVCGYMGVARSRVELAVIPDASEVLEAVPLYSLSSTGPAGLHFGETPDEKPLIGISRSLLKDPSSLVATIAHELGHVILLDDGRMARDTEDIEPMTDLVTVYLGFGIFTANACRQFRQFQDDRYQGWSMQRLGYLPEVVYGYALARFARERGEETPAWTRHLSTNLKTYFRQSSAWLGKDARPLS
ncbi:MAG TPA: hypothetical protein VMA34_13660 [Terracidiphilus sp.]|nr:hypothetical protein [Terracidiphilus sp.]